MRLDFLHFLTFVIFLLTVFGQNDVYLTRYLRSRPAAFPVSLLPIPFVSNDPLRPLLLPDVRDHFSAGIVSTPYQLFRDQVSMTSVPTSFLISKILIFSDIVKTQLQ